MTQKRWNFLKTAPSAQSLADALNIPPVIASILANREITDAEAAKHFLSKGKNGIHHPFLLKDAEKAAERIRQALDTNETVVIYGDYDVDGITSTSIVYKFLKGLGLNVSFYIPNRVDEGYGINILALQKIRKSGATLMVTVDCGITAVGEVEFAKTIGLDIIITDHHTCKEDIPRAHAVINPKQPDCTYPFKDLAGVGVAFKFILAIALKLGLSASKYFDEFIDIVAIGTIADVVSLTGENRLFVSQGLKKLQNTDNIGIQALFETAGIVGKPLSSGNISFMIAPRINAAGRVGSATMAVELLITDSKEKAIEIAAQLEEENHHRQHTEQEILKDALEMIDAMEKPEEKKVFVLAKEGWHHGVIGIVASRITDKFPICGLAKILS
ncbi:MAG: single-stranded-DNA-specific exonuclease RecJ [Clostridia bacterium]|nr:single-stranded-DNA-specific exonuclease RecJ [Clostridia bacterium]